MREIWALNKKAYQYYLKHFNQFVGYRIISSLMITLLLIPFFSHSVQWMMHLKGYEFVANGLLSKFVFSPQGFVLICLGFLIAAFSVLIELGGLVVLSNQVICEAEESRFIDIFFYTIKRIKYLFGIDGLLIVLYFVFLAPLLDSNIRSSMFADLTVPGFIMSHITGNNLYFALLVVGFILLLVLMYRWMFAIHEVILSSKPKRRFLKKSAKIGKGRRLYLLKYTLLSTLMTAIVFLILGLIFFLCLGVAILVMPFDTELLLYVMVGILLLLVYVFFAVSIPITMLTMTMLYHQLSGEQAKLNIPSVNGGTFFNQLLKNKFFVTLAVVISIGIASVYAYFIINEYNDVKYDVQITAHRGSSYEAPENTLAAIRKAIDNGADYAEIDVQMTKDGALILLHDSSLKRTTGMPYRPDEVTLETIKTLDAGSWFSESFAGEQIPTLEEVISLAKDKIKLNIEIKGSLYSPEVCQAVATVIRTNDLYKNCVVTSIRYEDILATEKIDSKIRTGYIMFYAIGDLEKIEADFYSVETVNVTEAFVSKAHRLGRDVHVWTVNEQSEMEEMLELGVDNIITDNDLLLANLIGRARNRD